MSKQSDQSHGLPNWLSAAILLLLICGAGWGLWHYFGADSGEMPASAAQLTDANIVGPNMPRDPRMRPPNFQGGMRQLAGRFAATIPDGVISTARGYLVKAGNARLDVDTTRGDWRYRYSYVLTDVATADEITILRMRQRIVNDPAIAEKAGATTQQVNEIRTVPGYEMVVDRADRTKMTSLFRAWLLASGKSATTMPSAMPVVQPTTSPSNSPVVKVAQQELVDALSDLGKRQLEPTRQAFAARAQQIHAILGDVLLQKLKPTG